MKPWPPNVLTCVVFVCVMLSITELISIAKLWKRTLPGLRIIKTEQVQGDPIRTEEVKLAIDGSTYLEENIVNGQPSTFYWIGDENGKLLFVMPAFGNP